MRFRVIALTSAFLVSAFGCSHEVESPTLTAGNVTPDIVCNGKPASRDATVVSLKGSGFTPMPIKTLEDTRQLALPSVDLKIQKALDGSETKADPLRIVDDPAAPGASHVTWTSSEAMAFSVSEADKIPVGLYTIHVTNPDGSHATDFSEALAVVPPPVIGQIKPPAICDDQADQKVEVIGTSFLKLGATFPTVRVGDKQYTASALDGCKPVPGTHAEGTVELCTSLTITIPKGDFAVTAVTKVLVTVTNPAPADCASSETIELTIEPPPKVNAVVPATVCEGGADLIINGEGFVNGATAELRCGATSLKSSSANVAADGKTINARFGAGAVPGSTCDVVVQNPDGCEDRPLPHKTVSAVSGPFLYMANPDVVFNGINTRVTLFSTTITGPLGADAVTATLSGQSTPVTTLTTTFPVPNHPNRVQATIPVNQAPGTYDIVLKDGSGCLAILPKAFTVTNAKTVTLAQVTPSFGDTNADTAVTISRDKLAPSPGDKPFVATPKIFLNPVGAAASDVATELAAVGFLDGDTVSSVVPKGTPVKDYDVVLVNPDGSVGVLTNGFHELATAPPVILTTAPGSITTTVPQTLTLQGSNFVVGNTVTMTCKLPGGAASTTPSPALSITTASSAGCGATCSETISVTGAVTSGDVCIVRLTNPGGAFFDYSAVGITNPSLNLNTPTVGATLNVGRRALVGATGLATSAARYVYAIGGDNGTNAGALDTFEFASVDAFGKMGTFVLDARTLPQKRTMSGVATVGRYIYDVGGDSGAGAIGSGVRAIILSPRETPTISDVDVTIGAQGVPPGEYRYRVSAIFSAGDTDNPSGESLSGDTFTVKLPPVTGKSTAVTLVWTAPTDVLGANLPNVTGYKIYRSPLAGAAVGTEALIGTVGSVFTFKDDGTSAAQPAVKPLPLGSVGTWAALPNLGTKRSGLAVAAAADPSTAGALYVYALGGLSDANAVLDTYEILPITRAANGHQTFGGSWALGGGGKKLTAARQQHGAWAVDSSIRSDVAGTFIYVGAGTDAVGGPVNNVDIGTVGAGGDFSALVASGQNFKSANDGYGAMAANGQLFAFGGPGPSSGGRSATITSSSGTLASNSWNSGALNMTHGRQYMGTCTQSAFIFLLGGKTDEPSAASKTTELVIH